MWAGTYRGSKQILPVSSGWLEAMEREQMLAYRELELLKVGCRAGWRWKRVLGLMLFCSLQLQSREWTFELSWNDSLNAFLWRLNIEWKVCCPRAGVFVLEQILGKKQKKPQSQQTIRSSLSVCTTVKVVWCLLSSSSASMNLIIQ